MLLVPAFVNKETVAWTDSHRRSPNSLGVEGQTGLGSRFMATTLFSWMRDLVPLFYRDDRPQLIGS